MLVTVALHNGKVRMGYISCIWMGFWKFFFALFDMNTGVWWKRSLERLIWVYHPGSVCKETCYISSWQEIYTSAARHVTAMFEGK
jgi:hypothetical protein